MTNTPIDLETLERLALGDTVGLDDGDVTRLCEGALALIARVREAEADRVAIADAYAERASGDGRRIADLERERDAALDRVAFECAAAHSLGKEHGRAEERAACVSAFRDILGAANEAVVFVERGEHVDGAKDEG